MVDYLLNRIDKIVFVDQNKTKNDIIDNALKISSYFKKHDIKKAEIFLQNSFEFACVFLGALNSSIKLILLDSKLSSNTMFFIHDENFSSLLENEPLKANVLDENIIFYLRTSGSSGEQKNIPKTLKQVFLECDCLDNFFDFESKNIFLSSVSHQHMYGFIFCFCLPLFKGYKIMSKQLKYPEEILNTSCENAIFISSPALLKRLQEHNLSSLKQISHIISAGSVLPFNVREKIQNALNLTITEIYGSTETGVIAHNKKEHFTLFDPVKIASNPNGGTDINSPWCDEFNIKDEVEFLNNLDFRLLGRSDRIIKLEDKRVSLISIEHFLLSHNFIKDCFIDKHPQFGRLLALIVLSEEGINFFKTKGAKRLFDELKKYLSTKYDSVFLVRYFKILEKLPTNLQGKITKQAFQEALKPKKDLEFTQVFHDKTKVIFKAHSSVELFYFTEHFPTFPLLPGFMQLKFVYNLAKHLNVDLNRVHMIENVKFFDYSFANDELEITLELIEKYNFSFLSSSGRPCSKGRIKLG